MPKSTILAEIQTRTFGVVGAGPIRTCRKLTYTYRRDGAGNFRAEFPATDKLLSSITLKNTYLLFSVGGVVVMRGLVERVNRSMSSKGKQILVISGRDQLGALAENTVGDLLIDWDFDGPAQILGASNVPNQLFDLDADGYATTIPAYYKQFTGESALSALVKVAEETGEHFRTPTDGNLSVVWMRQDTPDAPIRLLSSGGPLLHQNPDVAIIEEIEADHNGEKMANVIYPYGAGNGAARLTLADATIAMPAGYSLNAAGNTITNDAQQSLPSLTRAISKTFNEVGVIDDSIEYTIHPTANALIGSTTIPVEWIAIEIPSGTLLDLNGLGLDFVELSTNVSIGANILNVVSTTVDVLTTDTLQYSSGVSAVNREIASNALATAALAYLQRIDDPTRMVAYSMTVRGLPDSVYVGMKIPVLNQAPEFDIDDDLIILEITRTVDRSGRQPASLKVVPVDWFDQGEAVNIARRFEELRTYQAQTQPVTYAQVVDTPGTFPPAAHAFISHTDVPTDYTGDALKLVRVNAAETALEFTAPVTQYTDEMVRDVMGVALVAGTNITITPNDGADTITIDATGAGYTDEQAQDAVGAMAANSPTVSLTYVDATPSLTADVIDAELLAIAGLTSAADKGIHFTGAGTAATHDLTAFGRSLIAAAAASNARTTLGLVIGTDVQAQDAELAAIAGLTSAADRLAYFTGSGTAALATFTAFARTIIDDIDAAAVRTTLGLVIGTNVQAFDATLLSIAALGTAADRIAYTTGVDTWAETPLTAFGRSLIDDAAASNARTTLGLGTIAVEAEANYALLAGRASGQTLNGGTAANEDLTLEGTAHATKTTSYVLLQTTGGLVGIRVATPEEELHVGGDILTNNGGFYKSKTVAGSLIRIFGIGGDDIAYFGGIDAGVTEMRVRTGGSDRMVINATGLSIAGTALPQGKLHVHDGTGGWLNVSKTGVAGTPVVIIADGVGDVQGVLTCMYSLQNSDNTVTGGVFVLAKTASFAVTIGGTTWTFTVSGGGEFSVVRTAGTDTAIIVMTINWR